MDIVLPEKSGIEILKEIKQAYPRLPVIIPPSLDYDDKAAKEAIEAVVVNDCVKKPADYGELLSALRSTFSISDLP